MSVIQLDPTIVRPVPELIERGPLKLFIDGGWVAASTGETFESIDPATGEVLTTIANGSADDVDRAVRAARRAFEDPSWSEMAPYQRSRILLQIADVLEAHTDELATLNSRDMGGPFWLTRLEIGIAVEVFRHYAGWPTKLYGQVAPSDPSSFNYVLRQPLGVVAAITAWNGPSLQPAWKIAPALATGNTVVHKPADWSSLSAVRFAELLAETDLPRGVFNLVTGDGAGTGEALVRHPGVNKITFTGSTPVGRHIAEVASVDFKHVTLELGGKGPVIVFADADLSQAARAAALGFCLGSGQGCVAGSRIFVHSSVKDEFRALLLEEMRSFTLGDPFDPASQMGPLASKQHYDRVKGYLDAARQHGATVESVGTTDSGLYLAPTLIENTTNDALTSREEIFGPVASLMEFTDFDEAIRAGNDTVYGLAATVFTRDLETAHRAARLLDAGTVWINTANEVSAGAMPFGGFKQAGIGREHGTQVLDAYTEVKSVIVRY